MTHARNRLALLVCAAALFSCTTQVASAQLLDSNLPAVRSGKMTTNGRYATLRGTNVIAMGRGEWTASLYDAVLSSPMLSQVIAPLPKDSYHMTLHPLFTEKELPLFFRERYSGQWGAAWERVVSTIAPSLAAVQKELFPDGLHPTLLRPRVGRSVVVLWLTLPRDESEKVHKLNRFIQWEVGSVMMRLLLDAARTEDERQEALQWTLNHFVVPAMDPDPLEPENYHITLGYIRVSEDQLRNSLPVLEDELAKLVDLICNNFSCHANGKQRAEKCCMELAPPDVHWFTSMAAFSPMKVSGYGLAGGALMFGRVYPMFVGIIQQQTTRTLLLYVFSTCFVLGAVCFFVVRLWRQFRTRQYQRLKSDTEHQA